MIIVKLSDAWSFTAEADALVSMGRELVRRGHRVVVACMPGTPLAQKASEAGLETKFLPGLRIRHNPLNAFRAWRGIRRLVREIQPDVVHAYRSSPHALAALAIGTAAKVKLVRTRGTMRPPRRTSFNRMLYGSRTAATLVTAEVVRARMIEAGFPAARMETIYGTLDLARFDRGAHDREKVRATFGIPAGAPTVVHLARVAPVKGHQFLLRAVARVPGLHAVLVGLVWPGMEVKLKEWIGELGIGERIHVTGKIPDVLPLLAAADIGVVASTGSEALSRAALEYMAMSLPVVATAVGSLPEIVEHERTGLLVAPADAALLAEAFKRLLGDREQAASMGKAGREAAQRRFGVAAQADRLEAIYSRRAGG